MGVSMDVVLVLFEVGFVSRTPDAMLELVMARQTESCLIQRHERGDFGDAGVCQGVRNLCMIAADHGVIRSLYRLASGAFVSVETDLDREETRLRVAPAPLADNGGRPSPSTGEPAGELHA